VEWELGRLRSAGVSEVVAVDLTRAEFAIPVVRLIVPGLEGPVMMTVRSCRLGQRAMDLMSDDRPVVPPRPAGHGPDEHR